MPVSSSTEHWIKPDALTINLNHFGDPDYLQVSVLAGAVVMAFKQDVIGYNAAHNYRTWPLDAANTYLETTSAYNVYARLTRSEVNARALVVYDTVLRDIEGREITYSEDGSEVLGEANPDFFFAFLGQISASVNSNGESVQREWTIDFRAGNLDTNQYRNEESTGEWSKMFRLNKVTDLIEILKTISSAVINKLTVAKELVLFGKYVVDVKRSTDTDEDVSISDETIPTTKYVKESTEDKFLRKDQPDTAREVITFEKGLNVGEFVSGASGASIFKDLITGQTIMELDKLYVRMKAFFETLTIVEAQTISGKQIISPAGSVRCTNVEEYDDYYRCYFLNEQDGEKIENKFIVGDQAYSQMFNAKTGTTNKISNRYYWRLVMGVGENYIDLSKTDCDADSDAPMVGDVLNQRGHRYPENSERMNFIETSTVDGFSPSITLFHGVNSFSLAGKAYVQFGVDKTTNKAFMHVYGDMYVGDRNQTAYIRYTHEDGLEICGKLAVGTKLGDKDLQELIDSATPEGYQEFVEQVTKELGSLQSQIDGTIDSYFFQYEPSLDNYPASEWDTESEKKAHLNDTFTNLVDGRSWRWSLDGTYKWVEITDTATTKALALAGKAQDTADGKRRVFVDTPYPPYDKGDLWSRGSDYPLLICVVPKENGVYAEGDFDYADNNAKLKEEMQTLVTNTKDELNNSIGQAKEAANKYADEGIASAKEDINASIAELEEAKANVTEVYSKSEADGKITEAETSAINAAKAQADAAIALSEVTIKAYADGIVDDEEAARIKQAQENLAEAKRYAEEQAEAAKSEIENSYLFQALQDAQSTEIENGLVLTSLIQLRDTQSNIMSGINGLINANKGDKSIATWWGGGMYDLIDYYRWDGSQWVVKSGITPPSNIPSGLIRMDGTGYLAKGKFWWDNDGKIYADPTALFLSFDVENEGASLSATILDIRDKQTEFANMWSLETDSNGTKYLYSKYPLVSQGGVTMYAGTSGLDVEGIYDGLPIDGSTIYWENGVLKAQGGGGGVADSVAWADITGKPSFATVATSGSYNDLLNKPTLLSSFTNDLGFVTESALSGYLTLTGGTLTGKLTINTSSYGGQLEIYRNQANGNSAIRFSNSEKVLGDIGVCGSGGEYPYQPFFTDRTTNIMSKIYHSGNLTKLSQLTNDSGFITSSASISGNAASATKLATARTIWGQSFDGTGNIDNVSLTLAKGKASGGWERNIHALSTSGSVIGAFGLYGSGDSFTYAYIGASYNSPWMIVNSSGNIGINTVSPSYKLHVNGSLNATTIYQNGSSLSSILGNYLPLSGGTLTGNLTIGTTTTTANHEIGVYRNADKAVMGVSSDCAYFGLYDSDGSLGMVYVNGSKLQYRKGSTWYDIWHSGNDGSGSGLDADMLDGVHESSFVKKVGRYSIHTADVAPYNYIHLFRIGLSSAWTSRYVDFSVKTRHSSCDFYLRITTQNVAYGSGKSEIVIRKDKKYDRDIDLYYKETINSSGYNYYDVYMSLRANWSDGQYDIISNGGSGTLVFEDKRIYLDSLPSGYVTVASTSVSYANALNTARTIWGQSFDGTGNVSGNLSGVGNITGSGGITITSTGSALHLKYNNDDTKSVVLNASSFKPYDAATNLLDLGLSSTRWNGIYGNTLNLEYSGAQLISLKRTANGGAFIDYFVNNQSSKYWRVGGDSSYGFAFATNQGSGQTTPMIILASGNVGIGTIDPVYKLDVNGTFNAANSVRCGSTLYMNGTNSGIDASIVFARSHNYIILPSESTFNFAVETASSANTKLRIAANGDVGIGTTSPIEKLHVEGKILSNSIRIFGAQVTDNSKGLFIQASDKTNRAWITWNGNVENSDYLNIATQYGNIVLAPARNVGIGTTSPSYKLHVNGHVCAHSFKTGNSNYQNGYIELYDNTPYIDFHYGNSTVDYTTRLIEGLSGQLTCTGKFRIGLAHGTSTDYKFYVNGPSCLNGNTVVTGTLAPAATKTYTMGTSDNRWSYIYTAGIRRWDSSTATDAAAVHVESNNTDTTLMRVSYATSATFALSAAYGFTLKYFGTGGANANYLKLLADNQTATSQVTALCVDQAGNVGVGCDNNAEYKLKVNGTAYISSNLLTGGGITMYSQRILKNVIDERGLSLRELSVIKPTRYTWKDKRDERLHIGGIADDIQQVLPEVVYRTPDGVLTMDYGNAAFAIASSLIKPMIEHESEIVSLKRRVRELEEEVKRLRA